MKNKVVDWFSLIKQGFKYIRRTTSSEKFLMFPQLKRKTRKLLKNGFLVLLWA